MRRRIRLLLQDLPAAEVAGVLARLDGPRRRVLARSLRRGGHA
jgi:hypothetical protein